MAGNDYEFVIQWRVRATREEVYDILGRRVAMLFEGTAPAGTQTATWDASNAASGTYLARLTVSTPSGESVHTTTLTRVR